MFYTSWTVQLIFYSGAVQPELKQARDVKGSMKGFCKYISGENKRKRKKKESLLLNMARDLVMKHMKKAKFPSTFFSFHSFGLSHTVRQWSSGSSPAEDHQDDEGLLSTQCTRRGWGLSVLTLKSRRSYCCLQLPARKVERIQEPDSSWRCKGVKLESIATCGTTDILIRYEDGSFITLRVAKYRNRMLTEAVASPSFEILKTWLGLHSSLPAALLQFLQFYFMTQGKANCRIMSGDHAPSLPADP